MLGAEPRHQPKGHLPSAGTVVACDMIVNTLAVPPAEPRTDRHQP